MKRILFLTFFGFRDYISIIKNGFEFKGYTVLDIPLLELINDYNMKILEIADKIIDVVKKSYEDSPIILIFMFLLPNNRDFITKIKSGINTELTKIVFYNFDDPQSFNIDLIRFSRGVDYFLTPNKVTCNKIKMMLEDVDYRNIISLPLYEDYTTIKSTENRLDPSIKTNTICILYDLEFDVNYDGSKIIKDIKMLALEKNFDIKLFGESSLENIYSDIYEGMYNRNNIADITLDSKIIIYLIDGFYNRKYNPIISDIMFYKNIMMIPYSPNMCYLLKNEYNCLFFNKDNYIERIYDAVIKYDKYYLIAKNAHNHVVNYLSLKTWVDKIITLCGCT